ncbi:MAG: 2-hydroxyacid dehydrogenase [Clostridia bacterium]|nr:2-hydroxyacid dehydrogenase [Clostridia bacterium]
MKFTAVADVFLPEEYYKNALAKYPGYECLGIPYFGVPDRTVMREIVHGIEKKGSEACDPPAELWDLIEETEVLMVHLCPVSRKLLEKAKNLKLILVNRGGTENVNVEAATELGIPVLSNPAHNANAVAEFTIGVTIAEMRNIARGHGALMQGTWRERFSNSGVIFELVNQTIGLIGFGTIARLVAKKLQGWDVNIIVYDPYVSDNDPDLVKYGCKKVELNELLSTADVVSLHARASGEKPLLGAEELALLKPSAYLINTARSYLVDYDALYEILRDGKIRGAALDVFESEPIKPDHKMLTLDNVTVTNHRGGDTVNSYSDSPAMLFAEAKKFHAGDFDSVRFWKNKNETMKK